MSVELLDDKIITDYISSGILEVFKEEELAIKFVGVLKNVQLYMHSVDTARYAVQIAMLHKKDLDLVSVAKAGLLHDIGKVEIPISILNKPGKLNEHELNIMQMHPELGYLILEEAGVEDELRLAALEHHEKLSGDGYPSKISNLDILVQIITVSDIFSALTELRSYKKAMKSKEAFVVMRENMHGLNKELIDLLESRVFDESDDFFARQWAEFYRKNLCLFSGLNGFEGEFSI